MFIWPFIFFGVFFFLFFVFRLHRESGARHLYRATLALIFSCSMAAYCFIYFLDFKEVNRYTILAAALTSLFCLSYSWKFIVHNSEAGFLNIKKSNQWLVLICVAAIYFVVEKLSDYGYESLNSQLMFVSISTFIAITFYDFSFTVLVEIRSGKRLIERVKA